MPGAMRGRQLKSARNGWIDITLPVHDAMLTWPDDPPTIVTRFSDIAKGDPVTMTRMTITSHTGTHIDAPLHFIANGANMDMLPLEAGIGPARVIEIQDRESIKVAEIEPYHILKGERILFKTLNSSGAYRSESFTPDYVYITPEAAHYLAARGILMVGLDYISVGSIKQPESLNETHLAFLAKGVWIIEGLNLAGVAAGRHELICLPLRLEGGDAAPVRAVVRPY